MTDIDEKPVGEAPGTTDTTKKSASGRWPIIVVVVALVVGAAAFYGGMLYGSSQDPTIEEAMATLQNAGPEEMAQAFQNGDGGPVFMGGGGPAGAGDGQRRFNGGGGGIVGGEIISADAESITVQSQDGSSKIVFFSDTTSIARQAEGSASDLTEGTNVLVTGSANADGSVTADNIQIRPEGAPAFGPGG